MDIAALLRQQTGLELQEFAGATLTAEIPFSDDLVNRQIAERLVDHPHLVSVVVQAQEGDLLDIQVTPRKRFIPPVRVVARIDRQPEMPKYPIVLLRWSMPSAGALAMFAAPVIGYFKAMPAGITMDRDLIAVDLQELARARGLDALLAFVRRIEVHTRQGGFVARAEVAVPGGVSAAKEPAPQTTAAGPAAIPDA